MIIMKLVWNTVLEYIYKVMLQMLHFLNFKFLIEKKIYWFYFIFNHFGILMNFDEMLLLKKLFQIN